MPKLQVKTVEASQVWKSPDGTRKIYELHLDYDGKAVKAQTFSDKIATVGWEGEVETYERGNNTFVKQPAREGGYSGGGGASKSNYQPKDEAAIKAMWSIGQAVQLVIATKPKDIVGEVEAKAQELYLMVDRVKAVKEAETTSDTAPVKDSDLDNIKDIFNEAEELAVETTTEEDPWTPQS